MRRTSFRAVLVVGLAGMLPVACATPSEQPSTTGAYHLLGGAVAGTIQVTGSWSATLSNGDPAKFTLVATGTATSAAGTLQVEDLKSKLRLKGTIASGAIQGVVHPKTAVLDGTFPNAGAFHLEVTDAELAPDTWSFTSTAFGNAGGTLPGKALSFK